MVEKAAEKKAEAQEAAPPPKPTKEAMLAELLTLYTHNLEHAAPRSLYELTLLQEVAKAPAK